MKGFSPPHLLAVLLAIGLTGACSSRGPAPPPNVVLIMADDLGAECLGCYGGESYQTPHLDAMAAQGIRFANAYATPLCTPTRVQLMTGQYPFRTGWTGGIWARPYEEQTVDPERFNFAHLMKEQGYATAVAGKWQLTRFETHPDHATRMGFDEHCLWTWQYEGAPDGVRMEGDGKPSRFWSPGVWKNGSLMEDTQGRFGPDIYGECVVDFIERHQDEPFFVYYPMALPHWPYVPLPGMDGDRDGTMEPPLAQEYFPPMVAYTDTLVGRVIDAVERLGLSENTLILFTGDNGTDTRQESVVNGKVVEGAKGLLTEAGARVPLLALWPGTIPEGTVSEDLVDLTDILPTLAAVSGGTVPENHVVDGRSFLPQLHGEAGDPRTWVFVQLADEWFIRGREWRLRSDGEFANMENRYAPRAVDPTDDAAYAFERRRLREAADELLQMQDGGAGAIERSDVP